MCVVVDARPTYSTEVLDSLGSLKRREHKSGVTSWVFGARNLRARLSMIKIQFINVWKFLRINILHFGFFGVVFFLLYNKFSWDSSHSVTSQDQPFPFLLQPFGVNQPGPYIMYTTVDANGYLKNGSGKACRVSATCKASSFNISERQLLSELCHSPEYNFLSLYFFCMYINKF